MTKRAEKAAKNRLPHAPWWACDGPTWWTRADSDTTTIPRGMPTKDRTISRADALHWERQQADRTRRLKALCAFAYLLPLGLLFRRNPSL